MGLKLFRPVQSAYEMIGTEKLNRLARGAWNGAGALLWGLLGGPTSGAQWIGDAGKVSPGTGRAVNLAPGLGVIYVSGDDFTHNLRPVLIDVVESISLDSNTDPNGWDRIDRISIRPIEVEEENQNVDLIDPTTETVSVSSRPQRSRYGYEWRITKGTPAASPVAPSTPAGFVALADVIVRNAAASIASDDVSDLRVAAAFNLGSLLLTRAPWLRFGGESAFAQLRYALTSGDGLNAGDVGLVTHDYDNANPDGVLRLGELFATSGVHWPGGVKAAGYLTWNSGTQEWTLASGFGVKTVQNFSSFQRVTLELYGPTDPQYRGEPLGFPLTTFGDRNESSWDSWDANCMIHAKYRPSERKVYLQGYKLDVDSDYDPNGTTAFVNLFFAVM